MIGAAETRSTFPQIPKVERDNIPELLKTIDRWILWRAGPVKPNGKFDKFPIDPATDIKLSWTNSKKWLTYQAALAAYDQCKGDGIGIVLSAEHTITNHGTDHYLVALDFDNCEASMNKLKELWLHLGKPYVESSPSGKGLRIFALSTKPLKGGNDGNGHELYCNGRFMTVTGRGGRGKIRDATDGLVELDGQWFGTKKVPAKVEIESSVLPARLSETEQNITLVKYQLSFISSNTDYDAWRNIVWSILSTGWSCAVTIAQEWSMKAEHRYEEDAFNTLIRSFDPNGGITLGTLHHHAELNGCTKQLASHPGMLNRVDCSANRLLTAEEVKSLPNTPYIVRGLLPAKGVAAIYGESGSGKSFLAMDLVFAIAAGHSDWFDMRIKPAPVVYIALEGRGGISKRIKAWETHHKAPTSKQVRFLLGNFILRETRGVETLASEILASVGENAVVVVDTLNQSAPGADENNSADMSTILTNAKNLADRVQGLVILIHHAGKDPARGMRGHSSLFAAMDAVIAVVGSRSGRSWNVAKAKDDEAGISHDFELVPYPVGVDEDGLEVTSCAVRRTLNAPVAKAKSLSGKNQIAAMVRLRQLLYANPNGIDHKGAVEEVAAVLVCPEGRKASVAKDTIDRLIVNGHLVLSEGAIKLQ